MIRFDDAISVIRLQLKAAGSSNSIRSFQDHSISDAVLICELIDAIQPNTIVWDNVKRSAAQEVSCPYI